MTGFTPYFADKVIGHSLGGASWTPPATVYLQLHVGDPGPDGTASVSATSTRKAATWSGPVNGQLTLAADINWTSTARETISHISGWDALTSGHCLWTDELEEAKNLFAGDTLDLPVVTVQIIPEA